MNVLIAFATTEGQTRKIARAMAQSLRNQTHDVTIYECSADNASPAIKAFDAIVLAASVHHQRYQNEFYEFVASHLKDLQAKPVAFVSVSLSVTLASGEAEAREYVDDFSKETGLHLDAVHLAEGAVRYFEYNPSDELTVDLIVFKGQKKMPKRDGNPEYTDWPALESFARQFAEASTKSASKT